MDECAGGSWERSMGRHAGAWGLLILLLAAWPSAGAASSSTECVFVGSGLLPQAHACVPSQAREGGEPSAGERTDAAAGAGHAVVGTAASAALTARERHREGSEEGGGAASRWQHKAAAEGAIGFRATLAAHAAASQARDDEGAQRSRASADAGAWDPLLRDAGVGARLAQDAEGDACSQRAEGEVRLVADTLRVGRTTGCVPMPWLDPQGKPLGVAGT